MKLSEMLLFQARPSLALVVANESLHKAKLGTSEGLCAFWSQYPAYWPTNAPPTAINILLLHFTLHGLDF